MDLVRQPLILADKSIATDRSSLILIDEARRRGLARRAGSALARRTASNFREKTHGGIVSRGVGGAVKGTGKLGLGAARLGIRGAAGATKGIAKAGWGATKWVGRGLGRSALKFGTGAVKGALGVEPTGAEKSSIRGHLGRKFGEYARGKWQKRGARIEKERQAQKAKSDEWQRQKMLDDPEQIKQAPTVAKRLGVTPEMAALSKKFKSEIGKTRPETKVYGAEGVRIGDRERAAVPSPSSAVSKLRGLGGLSGAKFTRSREVGRSRRADPLSVRDDDLKRSRLKSLSKATSPEIETKKAAEKSAAGYKTTAEKPSSAKVSGAAAKLSGLRQPKEPEQLQLRFPEPKPGTEKSADGGQLTLGFGDHPLGRKRPRKKKETRTPVSAAAIRAATTAAAAATAAQASKPKKEPAQPEVTDVEHEPAEPSAEPEVGAPKKEPRHVRRREARETRRAAKEEKFKKSAEAQAAKRGISPEGEEGPGRPSEGITSTEPEPGMVKMGKDERGRQRYRKAGSSHKSSKSRSQSGHRGGGSRKGRMDDVYLDRSFLIVSDDSLTRSPLLLSTA